MSAKNDTGIADITAPVGSPDWHRAAGGAAQTTK